MVRKPEDPTYVKPSLSQGIQRYQEALEALKTLAEVPAKYASNSQKRAQTSDNDELEGRYPYKYRRADSPFSEHLPRPTDIKELSQWQDCMDV
jgi:hypothetical protein